VSTVEVDSSDLRKVHDALAAAYQHHRTKDISNAYTHLAREMRFSPLTVALEAQQARVAVILTEAGAL